MPMPLRTRYNLIGLTVILSVFPWTALVIVLCRGFLSIPLLIVAILLEIALGLGLLSRFRCPTCGLRLMSFTALYGPFRHQRRECVRCYSPLDG